MAFFQPYIFHIIYFNIHLLLFMFNANYEYIPLGYLKNIVKRTEKTIARDVKFRIWH